MENIEIIFDKLFNYFKVSSIKELAEVINTSQSTISKWKQRSSITPIKRKCRELGIYNEIFIGIQDKDTKFIDINNKLNSFSRNALVYLSFLLSRKNINNMEDYYKYQSEADEDSILENFIRNSFVDFKKDYLSIPGDRLILDEYFEYFLTNTDISFIFENKQLFFKPIDLIIKTKSRLY